MKPQVFILHYAGGNVYSFQALAEKLRHAFAVEPLELPGRGRRMRETILQDKNEAVADYVRQIRARRTAAPFVVFGHSMGATLGFSVVKELERLNDAPVCFIASGNPGPNVREREQYSQLPRKEFFDKLREMGGITDALSDNQELLDFFEPILRGDFALLEKATEKISFTINTPIHAVMGTNEKYREHIQNWGKYTTGGFEYEVLNGNHFFVFEHTKHLQSIIEKAFNRSRSPGQPLPG